MPSHNGKELPLDKRIRLRALQASLDLPTDIPYESDTLFNQCDVCLEVKPINAFHSRIRNFLGITYTCGECIRNEIYNKNVRELPTKTCSICGDEKSSHGFHKNRRYRDGLNSACKICQRARERRYRDKVARDIDRLVAFRRQKTIHLAYQYGIPVPDYDIKQCSKCKDVKNINEFYKCTSSPDGKSSRCISCHAARYTKQTI